jgi:hypothetical protein
VQKDGRILSNRGCKVPDYTRGVKALNAGVSVSADDRRLPCCKWLRLSSEAVLPHAPLEFTKVLRLNIFQPIFDLLGILRATLLTDVNTARSLNDIQRHENRRLDA